MSLGESFHFPTIGLFKWLEDLVPEVLRMKYHSLASDDRIRRRTIADAIEVLHSIPDFTEQSRASVQVDPLPLASGEIVGLVKVQCNGPLPEVICVVQMPTSSRFRAVRKGSSHQESFDIFRLDGAAVDGAGNVKLADDARLRAVELIPVHLPLEPTELEWRIVHHAIAFIDAEEHCYRRLRDDVPAEFREMVPDVRVLDCNKLSGLDIPSLEAIAAYIAERDRTLRRLSLQKIADALRQFGMRVPMPSRHV